MKYSLVLAFTITATNLSAQTYAHRTGYVTSADGTQIAYGVHGDGPIAVILVHGWSCDRTYWSDQTEALAKQYQVVTVDLAGHGGSGTGRKTY